MRIILIALTAMPLVLSGCGERERPPSPIDGRWTKVSDPDCSDSGTVVVIDGQIFGIEKAGGDVLLGKIVAVQDRADGTFDMETHLREKGRLGDQFTETPRTMRFESPNPARIRLILAENVDGDLKPPTSGLRDSLNLARCPAA